MTVEQSIEQDAAKAVAGSAESTDAGAGSRVEVSRFRAVLAALFLIFWCTFGALVMLVAKTLRLSLADSFPLFFHGVMCRLFALRPQVHGAPVSGVPTLFVANHISYMDVFVLGSLIPGAFVAKSEVAGWPVFGKLAKLQNTLFLERNATRAATQVDVVRDYLSSSGNLIMFPEGTSTPGIEVATFRSSLFAAAEGVTIQPVSVAYVDYDGESMSQRERDYYAWYLPDPRQPIPNRPFAAHFFEGLGLGRARVEVRFHAPSPPGEYDRKTRAKVCEQRVRSGLLESLGPAPMGESS